MVMRGLPVPKAKSFYIMRDAAREAARFNIPFGRMVDPRGVGAEKGLAVLHHAIASGKGLAFARSFLRGAFAEGMDAANEEQLFQMADRAGINRGEAVAALAAPGWRAAVATPDTPIIVRIADCCAAVGAWAAGQTDDEYNSLVRTLDIAGKATRDAGAYRGKLIASMDAAGKPGTNAVRTATGTIDRVLGAAFGITLGKRDSKEVTAKCDIDTSSYRKLIERYHCGCFADINPFVGFAMVEGDDP